MGKTKTPYSKLKSKKKRAIQASRASRRIIQSHSESIEIPVAENVATDFGIDQFIPNQPSPQIPINTSPILELLHDNVQVNNTMPTGRRIVDVGYIVKQLIDHKHVTLYNCTVANLQFVKENRDGFASVFLYECNMCKSQLEIYSENPFSQPNVNMAAVSGTIMSGNGFQQLSEIAASLNIPPISKRLYYKHQEDLHTVIGECTWSEIEKAGKEEVQLAKENGDIDKFGVPLLTVIVDGAWSKRSYKTNYNALSGVACIIGMRTKKIVFLGIRNKFCIICERATALNIEAKSHACYKNFNGPSTGMEASIIAEGFKKSMEMHGAKYNKLVGDGDSSVYRKLLDVRPYGDQLVQKIECSNHLLRNYCIRLKEISGRKFSSRGTFVPVQLRKLLENNIRRLRTAALSAAKYRALHKNVRLLSQDLANSVHHVFGDHSNCGTYFCKRQQLGERNWIEELKNCGLYDDINSFVNRLIFNAHSLLTNMSTNVAECYNSVIAKYVAAAISYNTKGEAIRSIHKKLSGNNLGVYTQRYSELNSGRVSKRKILRKRRKVAVQAADENYGLDELIPDMSPAKYAAKKEAFLRNIYKPEDELAEIEIRTAGQANSQLWYEERSKRLTASNFGRICKKRESTNPSNIVKYLIYQSFHPTIAMQYGIEKEPIARQQLENELQVNVLPCGLFIHKTDCYLAASPDGLIGEDFLCEIKCPFSARKLTPRAAIEEGIIKFCKFINNKMVLNRGHDYYFQIQGQLHITGRNSCYFVVWTPHGIEIEMISKDPNFWKDKMKEKLKKFYFDNMLPELVDPRHTRSLTIRNKTP
nr:uncharacterized protein LOC111415749 isoform X2 [Onthophagus taurus]